MTFILEFLKRYTARFIVYSLLLIVAGNLLYSGMHTALIYKQNFTYMLASSPMIGSYAVSGFYFLVFCIIASICIQFYNITKG